MHPHPEAVQVLLLQLHSKNLPAGRGTQLFADTTQITIKFSFRRTHHLFFGWQDEEMNVMMQLFWENLTSKEKQDISFISNTEVCTTILTQQLDRRVHV